MGEREKERKGRYSDKVVRIDLKTKDIFLKDKYHKQFLNEELILFHD